MVQRAPRDTPYVELRVHGVSGTPPKDMLGGQETRLVADCGAGSAFYRPAAQGDGERKILEAYSWSGLTSGQPRARDVARALWLMLLPFSLINVASWTEPGDPQEHVRTRRVAEAALRLLALALTCVLVTAAAAATVDLLGWQCSQAESCSLPLRGLSVAQGLGIFALLPAATIGVLWLLAHRTWATYETDRPTVKAPSETPSVDLATQRFWCGDAPVQRLRAVHVSAACALLAVLVTWPSLAGSTPVDQPMTEARVIVLIGLAVLVTCAVAVCLPGIADRKVESVDRLHAVMGQHWRVLVLPWLAVPLVGWAIVRLLLRDDPMPGVSASGGLPGLTGAIEAQLYVQVVAVAVLVLAMLLVRRGAGRGALVQPAASGLAPAVLAIGAAIIGAGLAASVVLTVEWALELNRSTAVLAPVPYRFIAYTALILVVAVLLVIAVGWLRFRFDARNEAPDVHKAYGVDAREERTEDRQARKVDRLERKEERRIAKARAFAKATDSVPMYLLILACLTSVVAGVFTLRYLTTPVGARDALAQSGQPDVNAGLATFFLVAVAIGYFCLGAVAYRTDWLRRRVGVIWDIASFWPRAVHPLAPPSYAEKAVPDLVDRVAKLAEERIVVLSAHSQGAVLATAAVLQLPAAVAQKVGLLTYGSPLTRLYGRFFPGYFHREAFCASMNRVGAQGDVSTTWPWLNLYRPTDPIGGWVFEKQTSLGWPSPVNVDVCLLDPARRHPSAVRTKLKIKGHLAYFPDGDFDLAVEEVVKRRLELAT